MVNRTEECERIAVQLNTVHQRLEHAFDQGVNHGGKTIDHAVNRNHTQPISGAHDRKNSHTKEEQELTGDNHQPQRSHIEIFTQQHHLEHFRKDDRFRLHHIPFRAE